MQRGSNLIGDSESIKHETTSYTENKAVYVTPSKIVTEKDESLSGRAIMLSKISMIKKKGITGPDPFFHIIAFLLFGIGLLFFGGLLAFNIESLVESQSANAIFVGILTLFCLLGFAKTFIAYKKKDWSAPEGVVWFNARGPEGGIGFKIKENNIRPILDAMEEGMTQDVRIVED